MRASNPLNTRGTNTMSSNQFNNVKGSGSNTFHNKPKANSHHNNIPASIPNRNYASEKLSLMDDSEDEKACFQVCAGPRSPLNWICELTHDKRAAHQNDAFHASNNNNNNSNTNSASNNNIKYTGKDPRLEARKKAAQSFFRTDSDEDISHLPTHPESLAPEMTANSGTNGNTISTSDMMSNNNNSNNNQTYIHISSPDPGQSRPIQGEARIVAPHVSKLAPYSAVEVRLQSTSECVAVLCSVDVLKMRSGFFHDVLNEQEKALAAKHGANTAVPLNHPLQSNLLWRDPIVIPENTPFEAAAFLESLHEGRALFKGEWNYCWARLSVTWVVEELILEYASQIEDHMNRIASVIQNNHWRTNPSVLSGMRVAVFRKSTGSFPTVITGIVLDSPPNIGYSKVRVAFDNDRSSSRNNYLPASSISTPYNNTFSPQDSLRLNEIADVQIPSLGRNGPTSYSTTGPGGQIHKSSPSAASTVSMSNEQQIVGDVTEPIWIQSTKEGSPWYEPDELFMLESKRYISNTDKRVFWEMARALIELPEVSLACKTGIKNPIDLANTLKRPEYRVLWTKDAPDCLPKDITTELIRAAYILGYNNNTSDKIRRHLRYSY